MFSPQSIKPRGDHYVECYIVKDGTCVAVARHTYLELIDRIRTAASEAATQVMIV